MTQFYISPIFIEHTKRNTFGYVLFPFYRPIPLQYNITWRQAHNHIHIRSRS